MPRTVTSAGGTSSIVTGDKKVPPTRLPRAAPAASVSQQPFRPTAPPEEIDLILSAEHPDPFHLLGPHTSELGGKASLSIRTFQPRAESVAVVLEPGKENLSPQRSPMTRVHPAGFFEAILPLAAPPDHFAE